MQTRIFNVAGTARPFVGGVAALFCWGLGPAAADISVSAARIAQGELWVIGQSAEAEAAITLDDAYEGQTDRNGKFEIRIVYHPASCIVTLKTASEQRQAVVGNCGQAGPRGEAGAAGPRGTAGPAGPPGPAGRGPEVADARPADSRLASRPDADASPAPAPVRPPARPAADAPRPPDGAQASLPVPAPTPAPVPRPAAPPPPPPPPAVGEWVVEDGAARISIQPCGPNLCGAVSWSKAGGELGTQILRNMKATAPNRWEGTIYDPTTTRSYSSNISLRTTDTLRVEGCVLGYLCGGQTWTRAK